MKLFVFNNVLSLSFSDGIIGVIADDLDHAVELINQSFPGRHDTWVASDCSNIQEFELAHTPEPGVKFYRWGGE